MTTGSMRMARLVKTGRDEARTVDQTFYDTVPDYGRTVEETWGQDDRVVSRFTIHGTMPGGLRNRAVGSLHHPLEDLRG